jgi:striatin 1/3/4
MLQLQHMQQQQPQQSSSPNPALMQQQQNVVPSQSPQSSSNAAGGERDEEPRQLTAIFRPDDAGEWKEKLRLSHEAEQARLARESQQAWDRQEEEGKEEDGEVDDDESSVVSDGEGNKVWRPKRTLRKCVPLYTFRRLILIRRPVTWMPFGHSPSTRTSLRSRQAATIAR